MSKIQNAAQLQTSQGRRDCLAVAEAAYAAIDTGAAIRAKISVEGMTLKADGRSYDLSEYNRIRVMGFGKVSCAAAQEIEKLLRGHVSGGAVIDVRGGTCEVIEVSEGTHPRPSAQNVALSEKLVGMAKESAEEDLVIVVVSGGGSSLLCWPLDECEQSARLYDDLHKTVASIEEMNTVRRHISSVKGGGLAAMLYPATVIGLVFCDIPSDRYQDVASGPTYLDESTVQDAERVLAHYGLTGYELKETPKDKKFFERVQNVPVVSNTTALAAMEKAASGLGYRVASVGSDLYDTPPQLIDRMFAMTGKKIAVIGAGEPSLTVPSGKSKGGRCQYVALQALERIGENDTFLAFASDGRDNSDAAGAFADTEVRERAREKNFSIPDRLADYDTYDFFKDTGAMLYTGMTDSNVSDLFVLLRP